MGVHVCIRILHVGGASMLFRETMICRQHHAAVRAVRWCTWHSMYGDFKVLLLGDHGACPSRTVSILLREHPRQFDGARGLQVRLHASAVLEHVQLALYCFELSAGLFQEAAPQVHGVHGIASRGQSVRLRKNANDGVQQREPLRLHCWRFVTLHPAKVDDCSIGVLQCEGSCPITSHVDAAPHSPMGCQALLALEYSVFQSKLGDVWRERGAIPGAWRSSRLSCPSVASWPIVRRELSSGGGEVCPTCNQVFPEPG